MDQSTALEAVVDCVKSLTEVFTVYDRALFYYDPAFLAASPGSQVDATRNYQASFSKLPDASSGTSDPAYVKTLLDACTALYEETLEVYTEAFNILLVSHTYIANQHANLLSKLKLEQDKVIDRDPRYAAKETLAHITRAYDLADEIAIRFEKNKTAGGWCSYSVEFDYLKNSCLLVIDEIDYLKKRANEIENSIHQNNSEEATKRSEAANKESLRWAIIGIFAGAVVGVAGVVATVAMPYVKDDGPPVINNIIPTAQAALRSDNLAIEIGKISERTARLEQMLDKRTTAPKEEPNQALFAEMKALREAVAAGNATTVAQLKEALATTERNLNDAISKIPAQQKKDDPAASTPSNQALADEIKALKESIAALKTAIETRPPPTIIIEDKSTKKHGLFNWF